MEALEQARAQPDPGARSRLRARRLGAAVVTSLVSKLGSAAYQLVAVPVIVASLGAAGYSEYAVVIAAFSWMGMLSVGLGPAVTERISSDSRRPIHAEVRGTFMTALGASAVVLAALVAAGALLLAAEGRDGSSDRTALTIAGLTTAVTVLGSVFDSALLGLQRSYVTNLFGLVTSLISIAATLAVARLTPSVAMMVLAALGPIVLARAASGLVLRRIEPGLWGGLGDITWRAAPRITGRGLVFAGISFSSFLSLDAGLLVVAGQLGSGRVADVGIVVRTLPLIYSIVTMITAPLWPAIAEAVGDRDVRWIRRAGSRAAALVMAYALVACVAVVVGGRELVQLWTGGRISLPQEVIATSGPLIILESWSWLNATLLIGMGRAGTAAAVLLLQGGLSLAAVAVWTGPFGQSAALIGPTVTSAALNSWLLPTLVLRRLRAMRPPSRGEEVGSQT